ncbi:MAG: hypothetical protein FWH12_09325, partial [Treponema sp.]|nr:hypothetical protein [Treponema sp.]
KENGPQKKKGFSPQKRKKKQFPLKKKKPPPPPPQKNSCIKQANKNILIFPSENPVTVGSRESSLCYASFLGPGPKVCPNWS